MNVIGQAVQIFLEGKACVCESTRILLRARRMTQNQTPEVPAEMGLDDQREEATAFWRALTLSDFSAARDVLRKVTPITPGAFVFPEAGEDVAAGDETK
eukprot:scaffold148738_cov44-Attheya_sp.AAC.1